MKPKDLQWHAVESSNVDKIAHDPKKNQMYVSFKKSGDIYKYDRVSEDKFMNLLMDYNPGKSIFTQIISKKTDHPFVKVEKNES